MILTVDDESGIRTFLADALTEAGHEVVEAENGSVAIDRLRDRPFDLAIVDLNMPGEIKGMDVVRRARAEWPQMQIIVLTAYGTVSTAVEAMRLGAFEFLEKPLAGPGELRSLVTRALNWRGAPRRPSVDAPSTLADQPGAAGAKGSGPQLSKWRRLSAELKRRHVYRVAVTYAAVVFVALQVAQLILPVIPGLAPWSYSALVVLLVAGFPAAIILGWIYDIRISRTDRDATPERRGRRWNPFTRRKRA